MVEGKEKGYGMNARSTPTTTGSSSTMRTAKDWTVATLLRASPSWPETSVLDAWASSPVPVYTG